MNREKLSLLISQQTGWDKNSVCTNRLVKEVLLLIEENKEIVLGMGVLEFDGVESSYHVATNWRSEGKKVCGKYGKLLFREDK